MSALESRCASVRRCQHSRRIRTDISVVDHRTVIGSSMPGPTRTLPRQILDSGFTASNPTLRHLRWSSGSTTCMPTERACATSHNSLPTMGCLHRASTTRRGIVTVTRRGWSHSAIRAMLDNPTYLGVRVWGKQEKYEVLVNPDDVALGMRHACGGVIRRTGSYQGAARMKR